MMKKRMGSCGLVAALAFTLLATGAVRADLVGWWAFDNASNVGQDSSTYGNDLSAQGDAAYDAAGRVGGALLLDGTGDMLDSPGGFPTGVPTGTGSSSYAISAWIKPNLLPDTSRRGIVGWGNYGTGMQVNAFRTAGTNGLVNYWWSADLLRDAAPVDLDDGAWKHVVATFDGTNRTIYVNGNPIGTDMPGVPNFGAANFAVGRTSPGDNEFFNGMLDDVAIWDVGLTSLDVQDLTSGTTPGALVTGQVPPPLMGLWQFDDPSNLGADSSSVGNDLTPQGGASFTAAAGVRGSGAVSLDGVNGMLDSPGGFPTDVPTGNDTYTIAAWIKPDTTGDRGIIGWGNYGATGLGTNALRVLGDNGFRHYWWGADLDAQDGDVAALGVDLDNGDWHHIAATYDGTTRTLYVDGQFLVSDTPPAHIAAAMNFAVGRTFTSEYFDGMLDDVAVLNVALNQQDIQDLMSTGDFSAWGGPVPEPSTFALAAWGLVALAGCRRRRR